MVMSRKKYILENQGTKIEVTVAVNDVVKGLQILALLSK